MDLVQDLVGRQVRLKALFSGHAEKTVHLTANL